MGKTWGEVLFENEKVMQQLKKEFYTAIYISLPAWMLKLIWRIKILRLKIQLCKLKKELK